MDKVTSIQMVKRVIHIGKTKERRKKLKKEMLGFSHGL